MLSKPSTRKIYLLNFLTLGFYFFYWCSHSRNEINRSARQELIPGTWLLALPGGNYFWIWQYSEALETVSYERVKASDTFLIYLIATSFWYLAYGSFSLPDNIHVSLALVIGFVVTLILIEVAGLAFFCAAIQKKINLATIHQPPKPFA